MSMYVIVGNGQMPAKEVEAQLADLINNAVNVQDVDIWFLLEGKTIPTDTDKAIVKYLDRIQAYYETFEESNHGTPHIMYANAAAHRGNVGYKNLIDYMNEQAEQEAGEIALLGLFYDFDNQYHPEDALLDTLASEISPDSAVSFYALNAAMVKLDAGDAPVTPKQPKEVPSAVPQSKSEYDKTAFEALSSLEDWTAEELAALTVEELRAICPNAPKKATKTELVSILLGDNVTEIPAAPAPVEMPSDTERIHAVLIQIIDAAESLLNYMKAQAKQ